MAKVNAYYCPKCKKYTKHIGISWREYCALDGLDTSTQILNAIFYDWSGFGKLLSVATGVNLYKCTECGRPTSRNPRGGEALDGTEEELKNR